jgi:CDP-glucose 4,6-dehydratase
MKSLFNGAFSGKRVLVTGHTGFKGSWLSLWLTELGAKVSGLALPPSTKPSLFEDLGLEGLVDSRLGDIRDPAFLAQTLRETRPEVVFHLAAQPLVRLSYEQPVETLAVNALGTANLLEAIRNTGGVSVCEVITTDKCYENDESGRPYRESDRLGGHDPYSASKACAELVVSSYRDSFFPPKDIRRHNVSLSSARAGNVIGGGDWAQDRLLPDCARALAAGRPIELRNPRSVRPWQFVLEPLSGYLRLASLQLAEPARYAQAWNFGPSEDSAFTTGELADLFIRSWGSGRWVSPEAKGSPAPHEAGTLQLDSGKARELLEWRPVYGVAEAVSRTADWYRASQDPRFNALGYTRAQIEDYAASALEAGLSWAKCPDRRAA